MGYTSLQFLRSAMKNQSQPHLPSWILFNKFSSWVLFCVFLVPIVSSEISESRFQVKTLPGLLGDIPFTLETGYIGVGEFDEVQLFYYFVESQGSPKDDPLILWLTGGPGCSGLFGILYEIGPFMINYANSTFEKTMLEINPHSWTKVANIIFIDQPAGTGFSYAKTPEAYTTNDTLSTKHAYHFLRKWLVGHPKFLSNPLYLGSDSYGGIMLPMVVQEIYNGNDVGEQPQMNIKGYMLGNPVTDKSVDYNARIKFAHRTALLSDEIYKSTKKNCLGEYLNVDPNNTFCINDLQVVDKLLERICKPHILEPFCVDSKNLQYHLFRKGLRSLDKTSADSWSLPELQIRGCREDSYTYSYIWANSREVREALHIREEFKDIEWVRCNETMQFGVVNKVKSYTYNVRSTVPYHRYLADKNCRALIYSGDHDMLVSYVGTLNWIESLNLLQVNEWTPWFVDKQVAGYTMKYSKDNYTLTYATLKGGGHTAPEYKPKECLSMFTRWIADDPL